MYYLNYLHLWKQCFHLLKKERKESTEHKHFSKAKKQNLTFQTKPHTVTLNMAHKILRWQTVQQNNTKKINLICRTTVLRPVIISSSLPLIICSLSSRLAWPTVALKRVLPLVMRVGWYIKQRTNVCLSPAANAKLWFVWSPTFLGFEGVKSFLLGRGCVEPKPPPHPRAQSANHEGTSCWACHTQTHTAGWSPGQFSLFPYGESFLIFILVCIGLIQYLNPNSFEWSLCTAKLKKTINMVWKGHNWRCNQLRRQHEFVDRKIDSSTRHVVIVTC